VNTIRRPLEPEQDAFGHALWDHLEDRGGVEIIERSDGYLDVSADVGVYFTEPTGLQAEVADRAVGRVLDVGCGAGRYALFLEQRGREVVAIDASPLAVEVSRRRGLRDVRLLTLEQVDSGLGRFDTVLMLGNNFGLTGGYRAAKRMLTRLKQVVKPGGRILAQTLDPYQGKNPDHLAYHAQNRAKGRMGGQIRMRVRYKAHKTPWFDYLFVSADELHEIVQGTGWHVREMVTGDGPDYVAVLEMAERSSCKSEHE
jgi:2-polyprenyl-3-methyl-5-hydroxy-6-metoxy-1,4-benzoquinol methylase